VVGRMDSPVPVTWNKVCVSKPKVTSKVDENTELELDDVPFGGSVASFLGMIDDDADPTNGSRDVVEVKIDTTNGNGTPDESYRADEIETEEEDD